MERSRMKAEGRLQVTSFLYVPSAGQGLGKEPPLRKALVFKRGLALLLHEKNTMPFTFVPKNKLANIPKTPGVYALRSGKELLYIGKAQMLQSRVKSHFQTPSYRDSLFIDRVQSAGYQETPSAIDALILESKLIKEKKPKYNVLWRDDKQYFFAGITKEEFPRVFLTHQPVPAKRRVAGTEYIGPFVDGRAIKRVLRLLRRVFPYYTARTHPKLPCPYCHLGLCPGPNPDRKAYLKNIRGVKAVLTGRKNTLLNTLQQEMKTASKNRQFEKAAALRDQRDALEVVLSHASLLAPRIPGTRAFGPEEELAHLLGAQEPVARAEAYDISNIQGREATGSMVTFLHGRPAKEWYRKFKMRAACKPNDFAMMEELVSRRMRHPEWPYPDLMVIDGGKGQLTAALRALRNFQFPISHFQTNLKSQIPNRKRGRLKTHGRESIAVVALAKKHNELFLPGNKDPILLNKESPAVRNFFLHIRDEAHRFAVSYHRKLMGKRA